MNKVRKVGVLDDEQLAIDGLVYQLKKELPGVEVYGSQYPKPFEEWCKNERPELVFLDMEMPSAMGLDVAKRIQTFVGNIVFVTAHSHYSLEAYETAVDYILKPVVASRLKQALDKIAALKPLPVAQEKSIRIPIKGSFQMVKELDIILLKGQRNYTEVVMADGESYLVARTLKNFSDGLSDRFWRVHKGTIVRSDAVQNIKWGSRPQLTMNNGLVVEASKTRLDELGLQA